MTKKYVKIGLVAILLFFVAIACVMLMCNTVACAAKAVDSGVATVATSYTITYHDDGGQHNNQTSYDSDHTGIEIKDAEKEGYIFEGWYRTQDFRNRTSYLVPGTVGNIELWAKFTPIKYTITYQLEGGLFVLEPKESYTIEDSFELVNCWKPYCDFVGWYSGNELVTSVTQGSTGNLTLTARFTPTVYSITYANAEGATFMSNPVESFTIDDGEITLPQLVKKGYTFNGWLLDGEIVTTVSAVYMGNVTVEASFTKIGSQPDTEKPNDQSNPTNPINSEDESDILYYAELTLGGIALVGIIIVAIMVMKRRGN